MNISIVNLTLYILFLLLLILIERLLIRRLFIAEVDNEIIRLGTARIHWSRVRTAVRLYFFEIVLIRWEDDLGQKEFAMFPISTIPFAGGLYVSGDDGILKFLSRAKERYNIS